MTGNEKKTGRDLNEEKGKFEVNIKGFFPSISYLNYFGKKFYEL